MTDFEQELKRALRRCDPPEGFADRVLARVVAAQTQPTSRPQFSRWHWPVLRWVAVAAMLAIIGAAVLGYAGHERRVEEANGQAAKQQVMLALRITGSKLRVAQKRLKSVEGAESNAEKTL
jgi:hypothetical protein